MSDPGRRGAAPGPPAPVYLDHASTSPVRPAVAEAMAPFLHATYGNASGAHRVARAARRALEDAREEVAVLLGARPPEVVFTGGGTESANLAVFGVLGARAEAGRPARAMACSAVEHAAVLASATAAARGSARVRGLPSLDLRVLPVDDQGTVDLVALEQMVDSEVALVSLMTANNEVGTIQPLVEAASIVRARAPGAVLFTDAVQAVPWLDIAREAAHADLVGVSAHKLGGPKGVGALVARDGVPLQALVFGGGQEHERRSGTHDVAGAVGLAMALREATASRLVDAARVGALRRRLAEGLVRSVPGTVQTVTKAPTLPGHCHVRFAGVEQEELLVLLDDAGLCASAGAACASGALQPSHVLTAMGVADAEASGSVRFTLGHTTTERDVARALSSVPVAVARLRAG